jgi:uncharacterized coiled-coil DUF342 family protein
MNAQNIYDEVLELYEEIEPIQERINELIEEYKKRPDAEKDIHMTNSILSYYD